MSSLEWGANPEYARIENPDGTVIILDNGKITTIPPQKKKDETKEIKQER